MSKTILKVLEGGVMFRSALFIVGLVLVLSMLMACNGPAQTEVAPTVGTSIAQVPEFTYSVRTDGTPDIRIAGSVFEVTTNNCGSPVSSVETFSRSREFEVTLRLELSQAVIAEVGGGIPSVAEAKLGAEVGSSLGIGVGARETVKAEREIETPGNSMSTARLQWEEVWSKGSISIEYADGSHVGQVPFLVLTTLRLTQLGIETVACPTSMPVTEESVLPTSTPRSVSVSTDTPTTVLSSTPTVEPPDTSMPVTDTPVPSKPTSTPTLVPTSTSTPAVQRSPIPVEQSEVIFREDFSDSQSGWDRNTHWGQVDYKDGEMVLNDTTASGTGWARPHLSFDNFVLEVDGRWSGGAAGGTYGLEFRYQDDKDYYAFYIKNDGRYEIGKKANDRWSTLLGGFSDAIDREGGLNCFHIEAKEHDLIFFINGQFLGSVHDVDHDIGDIMLRAWRPEGAEFFEASFDNVIVANHP